MLKHFQTLTCFSFTQKGWKVYTSKLLLPTEGEIYTYSNCFFPNKQKCWNTFKLWLVCLSLRRAERCTYPSYFYPVTIRIEILKLLYTDEIFCHISLWIYSHVSSTFSSFISEIIFHFSKRKNIEWDASERIRVCLC